MNVNNTPPKTEIANELQIKEEKEKVIADLTEIYNNQPKEVFEQRMAEAVEKYKNEPAVEMYAQGFHKNLNARDVAPQQIMRETKLETLTNEQLATICTHSTNKNNLYVDYLQNRQGIAQEGLKALRGDWEIPKDDKENPRVFFCQGIESVLIRMGFTHTQTYLKSLRSEDKLPQGAEITDDMLKMTPEKKQEAYKGYYDQLKAGEVILKLDIEDTIDPDALDSAKVVGGKDYPMDILKKLYGGIAKVDPSINVDLDNMKQNKWDLSTKPHESVPADKISILSINGSTSAIDIVKFFCSKMLDKNMPNAERNKALYNEMEDVQGLLAYIDEREKEALQDKIKQLSELSHELGDERIAEMPNKELVEFKDVGRYLEQIIKPELEKRKQQQQEQGKQV